MSEPDTARLPIDDGPAGGADPISGSANGNGHDAEDGLTYADALAELEEILASLEGADVDVDALADRVARGAMLIRFCQRRLRAVRDDVDAVIVDLLDDQPER